MNTIKKLLNLTGAEKRLLAEAAGLLPLTALMLRFRDFRWTRDRLTPRFEEAPGISVTEQEKLTRDICRCVNLAAYRGFYRPGCLTRSLVLYHILLRHGVACELILGTRVDAGDFSAHAWVESNGVVLNDAPNVREIYSAFDQWLDANG